MKKREIITFAEEELSGFPYSLPEKYDIVEEEQTDFDPEKGFCYYSVILGDKSTGRFYQGNYVQLGVNGIEVEPEFEEVFAKTITKTVYE